MSLKKQSVIEQYWHNPRLLWTLLSSPRVLALLFLGFASGLPLALTGSTLTAWYTQSGVSLMGIGFLTLVGQPYIYKFIWAPLMDRFIPPFLGRRRGWIMLCQVALIMVIASMALLSPKTQPGLLAFLALLVAFLSASQDISISAYLVDAPLESERGFAAAAYTTGYRLAMIVSGGLALVIAAYVGWRNTYVVMSVMMLIGVMTTWLAPNEPTQSQDVTSLKQAVIEPFKEFFQRQGVAYALLLLLALILYKLGDAFTLSLSTTFLLRGMHFTLIEVGLANKTISMIAGISGGIIGGIVMSRWSLFRALWVFGILQVLSNLMYMWLAMVGHHMTVMLTAVFAEHFCGGLGTVAFLAWIISLCDHRFSAMQFALLSALATLGRVYVGPSAAMLVDHVGWTWFYFWAFIIGVPGVLILLPLRRFSQAFNATP